MMRVLIIKTSSLGDVIHTLPALTDAARAISGIRFDWVVEEAFAEIPAWHPAVDRVIPVAVRHWRRHPVDAWRRGVWSAFKTRVREHEYDAVIDAQGLLKSAWLTRQARGKTFGFDGRSAREPMAARFYDAPLSVAKGQHAVERVRALFANALGYEIGAKGRYPQGEYGLVLPTGQVSDPSGQPADTVVVLHGTTWPTKHWPEGSWVALSGKLVEAGFRVALPWGNGTERLRARRIAEASGGEAPHRMDLTGLAGLLSGAAGCISVDTGPGHLAAAVGCPTVSLFGPTDPRLTGPYGRNQRILHSDFPCAPCLRKRCSYPIEQGHGPPCFDELSADRVFAAFRGLADNFPSTANPSPWRTIMGNEPCKPKPQPTQHPDPKPRPLEKPPERYSNNDRRKGKTIYPARPAPPPPPPPKK
uniref:Lipopolysaccharide heptosyltransferase 1 n=1 Tax=Candidatus Kentrum eta TaxID=2126337 RepID=A0A450URH4_9GAMM|nr:MAG: heptosyltransferase-1 [Candidatus Kentron sp. H]VFJ96033.1 MAG: heptosyltransferase-1 [Candidatus Kentron sp. H]VFK02120.1 MAG: heptosyltransferase-1 [Candidatus Kentron sp. H]